MTTTTAASVPAVAFVASGAFVDALDEAAGREGLTRSHFARALIAKHLQAIGALPAETAITRAAAKRARLAGKVRP